jgi:TusA-related sulfurtransferase
MEEKIAIKKIGEKHYTLDIRGSVCPYPQLFTIRALDKLTSGDTLDVTLDNPPSVRDIPPVIEKKGHNISKILNVDKGVWQIIICL